MKTTGERIKEARLAKGLTQTELAKKLGVQHAAIHKYESGAIQNLKRSTIAKLAKELDVRPTWLMCMEDEEEPAVPTEKELLVQAIIEKFSQLSDEQIRKVLQYAEFLRQTEE